MNLRALAAPAVAAIASLLSAAATAQDGGFALNQLRPAPAGDAFFGVASPYAAGHLAPSAYLMFDYAHQPVRLTTASGDEPVVSARGFLRLDASLALWERLLFTVDVPVLLVSSGSDPGLAGVSFVSLESPQMGDLRVGARGRLLGDDGGPFQLGLGGYFFAPTGNEEQYSGDGGVRGAFEALAGGRVGDSVGLLYTAAAGVELRASDSPHAFTYGAAVGLLLLDDMIQVGPEIHGVTALSGGDMALSSTPVVGATAGTNAELLVGAKLRVLGGLTFGAGAGPGLSTTVGTPLFRALGTIGWTPLPAARPDQGTEVAAVGDKDDDGINDDIDACPDEAGEPNPDPTKDGCPPSDRDKDGVLDIDDACPNTAGVRSVDATKNGCPQDSDDDGFADTVDACPKIAGDASDDPTKRGCPGDDDGDGIFNDKDACRTSQGDPHDDPDKNGCPPDPDNDGIRWSADACPEEKGEPNQDPQKNGCPRFVRMTKGEIVITQRIEFQTYGDDLAEAVTPNSMTVLKEVAQVIKDHPEIKLIEVQGHTDDSGKEEFNVDLSQRRAETVRKWLIERGDIEESRLVAKGYGFSQPLADNRFKQGRQANRRVQFVVIDRREKK